MPFEDSNSLNIVNSLKTKEAEMINKNFNQSNLARGGKVLGPGSGKKLLRPQKRAGSTDRSRRVGQSDNQQPRLV